MGITVVSTASLNLPGKGAAGLQLPTDGSADFAALLFQQLSAPQLPDLQLPLMAGPGTGVETKDPTAELAADDLSAEQDAGSLLAAAGLLPAAMVAPKPSQPAAAASSPVQTKQEDIAGIIGDLNRRTGDDRKTDPLGSFAQESPTASLAGELQPGKTANIAATPESSSGNGQSFAATLAAQSAQTLQPQTQAHPRNDNSAAVTVSTPLQDSRWTQDFGDKVVWLAKNDQQVAQININPPQLGPMHITLNLNGDQASALFVSPHAEVRQAIEDAMPHLREVLAGAGINLGQANVGTQLPQQNGGAQPQFSTPSRSGGDNAILRAENGQRTGTSTPLPAVRAGRGMVDLFA